MRLRVTEATGKDLSSEVQDLWFAMSNPALSPNSFSEVRVGGAQPMTLQGTVNKSVILLALMILPAIYTWQKVVEGGGNAIPWLVGGVIGGLVFALITIFKKDLAPVTAPIYAFCEGLALGGISALYETRTHGIVFLAVLLTTATLLGMLGLYTMRIVRATEKFKLGVFAATAGIALTYLVTLGLSLFGIHVPFVFDGGGFGIIFSLVVVVIAALNLVIDFDVIEQGCLQGAPKYMEWYGAFGLMVTLVWLYLEILRLLSRLNRR